MMMNALSIGLVVLIAYVWMGRGFLSSFLNLVCVLIAGGIAFAAWEPAATAILGAIPAASAPTWGSVSWAAGLAVPFAVSLAVLRLITDGIVRSNMKLQETVDAVGGAACGAAAGVIVAGVVVISMGYLRAGHEQMGYTRLSYDSSGSLVRSQQLLARVDTLTAALYKGLSERTFRSPESLAKWRPTLADDAAAARITYQGGGRNTLGAGDFRVIDRYVIPAAGPNSPVADLLRDSQNPPLNSQQLPKMLDGEEFPPGSSLHGFGVEFGPGSFEKEGRFVTGVGQVRLISRNEETGRSVTSLPVAIISQATADNPRVGRWRFDGRDIFPASVGGGAQPVFTFEFVVPPGYEPIGLFVRNLRVDLREGETSVGTPKTFATATARDEALGVAPDAALTARRRPGDRTGPRVDENGVILLGTGRRFVPSDPLPDGIGFSEGMDGMVVQKSYQGALQIDDENRVVEGIQAFRLDEVQGRGLDRQLRIERFVTSPDTVTVQVNVSMDVAQTILGPLASQADLNSPPLLTDTDGGRYQPVGYLYRDSDLARVRFTPSRPIASLNELASDQVMLSRSRPDQKLVLVFRVSRGVTLQDIRIGETVYARFDPPLPTQR